MGNTQWTDPYGEYCVSLTHLCWISSGWHKLCRATKRDSQHFIIVIYAVWDHTAVQTSEKCQTAVASELQVHKIPNFSVYRSVETLCLTDCGIAPERRRLTKTRVSLLWCEITPWRFFPGNYAPPIEKVWKLALTRTPDPIRPTRGYLRMIFCMG